jgi:integrase
MVKPRGNSYQADVTIRRVRYRRDFPTQAQAEKYEADARALPLSSVPAKPRSSLTVPDGVPTLEWLLRYVHATHWKGMPSERTAVTNARHCVEFFGPTLPSSAVDEQAIERLVANFVTLKYTSNSMNSKLAALGLMLRKAYERAWIERLPAVESRGLWVPPFRTLSEVEEARLLAWCRDSCRNDLHALVLLLIDTGAALAEVLRIEWEDVSTVLRVRGRGGRPERTIPLTERLSEILASRRGTAAGFDKVFPRGTRKRVEGWWGEARSALGLDADAEFTLNCLQDTFCVRRLKCGEYPAKIYELTGVSPGRLRGIVNAWLFEQRGECGSMPGSSTARKSSSRIAQARATRRDAERAASRPVSLR